MSLIRLMSDTPKSRTKRAIGIDITVMHPEKTLTVHLISPWKSATLEGLSSRHLLLKLYFQRIQLCALLLIHISADLSNFDILVQMKGT